MNTPSLSSPNWIAFAAHQRVGQGLPRDVAVSVKGYVDRYPNTSVLVLDAHTSQPVELDLRGTLATVLGRLPAPTHTAAAPEADSSTDTTARGPGRPKLGVVAREVTLLPRHWEWLGAQPGGASVALRKIVEQTLRSQAQKDQKRAAQESAYRFMHAVAGDLPGFEEASRALFAGQLERLQNEVASWPPDVREHLLALAGPAMSSAASSNQEGKA